MTEQHVHTASFGKVIKVQMPLVTVAGLAHIKNQELVTFESGSLGQVLSFSNNTAKIMAFQQEPVAIGSTVTSTGNPLQLYLDLNILGTVLSPLGQVISSPSKKHPELRDYAKPNSEKEATTITTIDRAPLPLEFRTAITEQLVTGITHVDSLLPLAKGQRQLIAGDRQTEKTPFLYQVLLSQAATGAKVVFALIGKRYQEIAHLAAFITKNNLEKSVVVVASNSQDSPSVISLTPFTAIAAAEYLRDQGNDVVVFLDDLTTHAKYWREVSLLADSFSGRDSYPGNIFYTHAKLLERAGAFTMDGSIRTITALPVAQTQENEVTDYIVSNLISITDGHLLFDTTLKQRGQHPPINTPLSVTRVGKQTQSPLGRQLNAELSVLLNHYQRLVNLMHFGNELSSEAKNTLQRGKAAEQVLHQTNLEVVPLLVQYIIVGATLLGWWDGVSLENIPAHRQKLSTIYLEKPDMRLFKDLEKQATLAEFSRVLESYRGELEKLWQS